MDAQTILQLTYRQIDAYRPFLVGQAGLTMEFRAAYSHAQAGPLEIDPVAVCEILGLRYVLADRSLVRGVSHVPWRCLSGETAPLPDHGDQQAKWPDHAETLHDLIREEVRGYIAGYRCLGILLSGGMDSRITAGILRELEQEHGSALHVVALTWGVDKSRDVVYAQEIARRFGWEWVHLPLTAERLAENIETCGLMGAEYSPLHLHGLGGVRNVPGLEVVIAGSYGDSIGRGEYSGVRVGRLSPLLPKNLDRFAILRPGVCEDARSAVLADAYGYRRDLPATRPDAFHEIERQRHYMSRLLSSCMQSCCWPLPVRQAFTSPEVVAHMWRLAPTERDDRFYAYMVERLPGRLNDLPWARTGRAFGRGRGPQDAHGQHHHAYGRWLREDLGSRLAAAVQSDAISRLGLFSTQGLDRLLWLWRQGRTDSTSGLDEIVSWLASVAAFAETFQVQGPREPHADRQSQPRGAWATVRGLAYCHARNAMRS